MLFKGYKVERVPITRVYGKVPLYTYVCVRVPTGKHIRHVLVPYPCTDTLIPMGKNGTWSPSEVEKEDARKEKSMSTVCQELQCFTSVLLFNYYILFPWFKLGQIISPILNTWTLMLREVKWLPRSDNYQQMQPVYLIIFKVLSTLPIASLCDYNYSHPFYKYALIYSDSRHWK